MQACEQTRMPCKGGWVGGRRAMEDRGRALEAGLAARSLGDSATRGPTRETNVASISQANAWLAQHTSNKVRLVRQCAKHCRRASLRLSRCERAPTQTAVAVGHRRFVRSSGCSANYVPSVLGMYLLRGDARTQHRSLRAPLPNMQVSAQAVLVALAAAALLCAHPALAYLPAC